MKTYKHSVRVVSMAIFLLLTGQACNDHNVDPIETRQQLLDQARKQLTMPLWTIQRAAVDGVVQTTLFKGMTLKFNNEDYTTIDGGAIWPAADSWKFMNDQDLIIIRGDSTTVAIQDISSTQLTLALTWNKTTLGGGRLASISGKYVFSFEAK